MSRRANEGWRTLSFTPALPDTRGWWFEGDGTPFYFPIIGWLVQEHVIWNDSFDAVDPDETPGSSLRDRRVLPAMSSVDGGIDECGDDSDTMFVRVLAPGESLPTVDAIAYAWANKEALYAAAIKRSQKAEEPPPVLRGRPN